MMFPNSNRKWSDHDSWFMRHSLSIAVLAVFAFQAVTTIITGHHDWVQESSDHGQTVSGWPVDFWWHWSYDYLTSIAAEPWGFLVGVLLTKWFYEQGSAESE